jgi:hypothetical protein
MPRIGISQSHKSGYHGEEKEKKRKEKTRVVQSSFHKEKCKRPSIYRVAITCIEREGETDTRAIMGDQIERD